MTRRWIEQAPETDPGPFAPQVAALGPDLGRACRAIQGFLIHGATLADHHLNPAAFPFDRRTLSVSERLARLTAGGASPIAWRRPSERALGTCRDFALFLCSVMRAHGRPARVRCGFAAYFEKAAWEDHWICEVADTSDNRWRRADGQVDDLLLARAGVDFDPTDIPCGQFLTAAEAWRMCREGREDAVRFGHGQEARGLWFLRVNLLRDRLALTDQFTSPWDEWRTLDQAALIQAELDEADRIAALPPEAEWSA